ncbi:hypothetical protein MUK42_05621 [Musa troglodytarum]|uniref:Uncharacterized protein n=1 Tax=Musa troglodytarum TaxID=320322 RepID=A0A9E7F3H4_9LILI|nr:hypothetical protein MUK42_05621 [Musa troglodytarum]
MLWAMRVPRARWWQHRYYYRSYDGEGDRRATGVEIVNRGGWKAAQRRALEGSGIMGIMAIENKTTAAMAIRGKSYGCGYGCDPKGGNEDYCIAASIGVEAVRLVDNRVAAAEEDPVTMEDEESVKTIGCCEDYSTGDYEDFKRTRM